MHSLDSSTFFIVFNEISISVTANGNSATLLNKINILITYEFITAVNFHIKNNTRSKNKANINVFD